MKSIKTKHELYEEFMRDIYSAEVLLVPALIEFKDGAHSVKLQSMLQNQIFNIRMHELRLEDLMSDLHLTFEDEHCRTMTSMIKEAVKLIDKCDGETIRDIAIAASVRRINQCLIGIYQMLITLAQDIGLNKDAQVLRTCLNEVRSFQVTLNNNRVTVIE